MNNNQEKQPSNLNISRRKHKEKTRALKIVLEVNKYNFKTRNKKIMLFPDMESLNTRLPNDSDTQMRKSQVRF